MYGFESSKVAWYNIPVETVRENDKASIIWNLRIPTNTRVAHRWPDLRIESKKEKEIWIVDMSCPSDGNVKGRENEKKRNYADLVLDLRMQRPGWKIKVLPLVVGVTGGIMELPKQLHTIFKSENITKRCTGEMQKVTVQGSQQMIHRIECGLV